MAYDRYDWHSGGDFPVGLPVEAGGTHIAMFLAWMILKGHAGSEHLEDTEDVVKPLELRKLTPGQWFFKWCDGKFWHADLDEEGNKFAASYYAEEGQPYKAYIDDYSAVFSEHPELYTVPDSWESFDRLSPAIDAAYVSWKTPPKTFWQRIFG